MRKLPGITLDCSGQQSATARTLLVAIFLIVVQSGCTMVRSQVVVFHDLPQGFAGTTYAMIPLKEQEHSLEHRSYENVVRQELDAKGFKETPSAEADLIVVFSYGIDTGKQVVSSYPIFGQTGVSSSTTYGTVQNYGTFGTYSGSTTYTPTYGVVGSGVTSQTHYTRFLTFELLDKNALAESKMKKLYEGKVVSSGSSEQVSVVLPTMIKTLFEDFPGKSGTTRTSNRALQ